MKKIISLVVMVILASFLLVGCGDNTPAQKLDSSKPATTSNEAKKPQVFKVGDSFKLGNMQFTINGVRTATSSSNQFMNPKEGNKWVYIDVTVQNAGDKQETVSSMMMFTLKDKEGVKYNITFSTDSKGSVDGNLVVGGKIRGELVYEVPIAINDYDLEVQSSLAGSVAVVSIQTTK